MNLSPFIQIGIYLLTTISGFVGLVFYNKFKLSEVERDHRNDKVVQNEKNAEFHARIKTLEHNYTSTDKNMAVLSTKIENMTEKIDSLVDQVTALSSELQGFLRAKRGE